VAHRRHGRFSFLEVVLVVLTTALTCRFKIILKLHSKLASVGGTSVKFQRHGGRFRKFRSSHVNHATGAVPPRRLRRLGVGPLSHMLPIVVSKAYGLYLGCLVSTPQAPYRICGSELSSGATGTSRMAPSPASRYGSAGELLAWRPDHVGHGAFNGCDARGHTGPLARECSVHV
jgi:hypothetical protein